MYPDHEITNIVETSYWVTISEWPDKNGKKTHSHKVRPYRCIVGPFQSDALLVPQHCVFDHHHDTDLCMDFDYWNNTANKKCHDRHDGKTLKESFAMLLECELDKFNGVEFVCCPEKKDDKKVVKPDIFEEDNEDDSTEDDDEDDEDNVTGDYPAISSEDEKADPYHAYLNMGKVKGGRKNEHHLFTEARKVMKKQQREKMTKLMKEWQAARDHIEELRKTNAALAKKVEVEITAKFKRLYKSSQQEDKAEKIQLVALHQQRVQSELNNRKRVNMDKYIAALQKQNVHKVLKALKAYIRAEENDRMHTVNHYEHTVYTDKEEAKKIYPHMQEHLDLISQRLNQTMVMLARFPEIERQVLPDIQKFRQRYKAVDQSILNIVMGPPETEIKVETSKPKEDETVVEITNESSEPVVVNEYDPNSETIEDEHTYHFAANAKDDTVGVDQDVNVVSAVASNKVGSTFGIAIGSVSIFVIIVVAIVMLRRRTSRSSVTHGYVEVDPAASPEERHVANMQMNGYENPTYRYFEIAT
ncbi:hypothetical protein LOTGIDRAFT_204381 [Lottia gigantea]|uniref:Amyloid-beta A4 protein n=1 Tax=Lottia gigantea TaxID=225164 RepID=V3ZBV4_LOTGI|nr:hypothetical protein LOTGIDRAFT_204381 [Lottia gigantea]ESO88513.1 hypothetical protein LOTGIDRAFT_204381 [Lottia gigantea]